MTATIEPRLIHLLNESTTPQLSSTDLPPLAQLPFPKSSDLPLPPIDSDSGYRAERHGSDGLALLNSSAQVNFVGDDVQLGGSRDEVSRNGAVSTRNHGLQFLLSDNDPAEPQISTMNYVPEDASNSLDETSKKKRTRALNVKDDFMQLPQPVKKQKAAPQTHVMPPIINGLHEPPPHAALFPPIASSSTFPETGSSKLRFLQDLGHGGDERSQALPPQTIREDAQASEITETAEKAATKVKKRALKPRSKWSEEETRNLLLGVSKHGVGKWKNILGDPEYHFNGRSAGDLKDRFRTCCPDELRNIKKSTSTKPDTPDAGTRQKAPNPKIRRDLEKILINVDEVYDLDHGSSTPNNDTELSSTAPKKSRAHRKKMKDLAELGIIAPFRPSGRRERRPFTDEEDKFILEGLEQYGPAWTKIQRDPRFNLSNRQPTDLRDRVRNGYPSIYQSIEKGTYQTKKKSRSTDVMEPSVVTSIGVGLERPSVSDLQSSKTGSKEELPRWQLQILDNNDGPLSPQPLEFGDSAGQTIMGGEMDISRLLLDEPRLA